MVALANELGHYTDSISAQLKWFRSHIDERRYTKLIKQATACDSVVNAAALAEISSEMKKRSKMIKAFPYFDPQGRISVEKNRL